MDILLSKISHFRAEKGNANVPEKWRAKEPAEVAVAVENGLND